MLAPHERDKLQNLHSLMCIAQRRLAKGLRLNIPEANALISGLVVELAREGTFSVADLMDLGHSILGYRQVLPGMIDHSLAYSHQFSLFYSQGLRMYFMKYRLRHCLMMARN